MRFLFCLFVLLCLAAIVSAADHKRHSACADGSCASGTCTQQTSGIVPPKADAKPAAKAACGNGACTCANCTNQCGGNCGTKHTARFRFRSHSRSKGCCG